MKPKSVNTGELLRLYREEGRDSSEFCNQVKKFIVYLQWRHVGRVDEDLSADCFLRLWKSWEYYDETRTNVVTWIYSVVRSSVSSFLYKLKKQPLPLETVEYCLASKQCHYPKIDFKEKVLFLLMRGEVRIVGDVDRVVDLLRGMDTDSPFIKDLIWSSRKVI